MFCIEIAGGRWVRARRLLVATGLVDGLPDIDGLADRWGSGVLRCPYCHGWEARGQAIGIIAVDTVRALHQALLWRQWSDDVTLFLHTAGAPSAEQCLQLAARGIPVVAGEVAAVEADADGLTGVRLWSGEVVARQAVAVGTRLDARAQFLTDLGLAATGQFPGDEVTGTAVPADATGATSVPGVYVAGNVTNLMAQVIVAAAAGMTTAAAINADLVGEDTRRAGQGFRPSEMLPCPDGCHAPWTVVP
jgi:thioredoxin reductase